MWIYGEVSVVHLDHLCIDRPLVLCQRGGWEAGEMLQVLGLHCHAAEPQVSSGVHRVLGPLGTRRLALRGPPPLPRGGGDGCCSGHTRVSLSIHNPWRICLSSSFSGARAVGFNVVFLAPLNIFAVSASSFPLYNMVTTSGHRWFSPSPSCTEVYFRVLPACLCPISPARHAFFGHFPSPCFSHISSHPSQNHSSIRVLQRHFLSSVFAN